MRVIAKARAAARKLSRPVLEVRERYRKEPLYTALHETLDPELHIREAAQWLIRAQDSGPDQGVSYGCDFGEGFLPSYPETTGYIICTFLALHRKYGDNDYLRRAIAMGEWESAVQMSSGAVMGGMYNRNPTPAVFNTGMVLLGWSALLQETGSEIFRVSGERGAGWLLDMQEPDGNWIRGNSQFVNSVSTVYNVKAAWGLARIGQVLHADEFISAAVRNAEFAVDRQRPNGWFQDCCLEDAERPVLHAIAYTIQGLLGIGKIADRPDLIDAAARTASSLMKLMDSDGFIPGMIDSDFRGAASWSCLTGTAQTSIVWSELERLRNERAFGEAAERANRYLLARHDVSSSDPAIRGGVSGSWPVSGQYGRYKILNWATKFFIDALLMRSNSGAAKFLA